MTSIPSTSTDGQGDKYAGCAVFIPLYPASWFEYTSHLYDVKASASVFASLLKAKLEASLPGICVTTRTHEEAYSDGSECCDIVVTQHQYYDIVKRKLSKTWKTLFYDKQWLVPVVREVRQ